MSEDQRFTPYTNDAVKFGEEMYEDDAGDYVLYEYASRTLLNQRVNSNAVIEELKEDIEELKANLESETKVANSLRMVCKRNEELLKEIKGWSAAFEVSESDKDSLNTQVGDLKKQVLSLQGTINELDSPCGTETDIAIRIRLAKRVMELEKAIAEQDAKKNAEMETFARDITIALENAGY